MPCASIAPMYKWILPLLVVIGRSWPLRQGRITEQRRRRRWTTGLRRAFMWCGGVTRCGALRPITRSPSPISSPPTTSPIPRRWQWGDGSFFPGPRRGRNSTTTLSRAHRRHAVVNRHRPSHHRRRSHCRQPAHQSQPTQHWANLDPARWRRSDRGASPRAGFEDSTTAHSRAAARCRRLAGLYPRTH